MNNRSRRGEKHVWHPAMRDGTRPKEAEDFLWCRTIIRSPDIPVKLGICLKCSSDFYTVHTGGYCSSTCSKTTTNETTNGYARVTVNGKRMLAHRAIIKAPPGYVVHHKNENKKDNRPENLEIITRGEHTRMHLPQMIMARYGDVSRSKYLAKRMASQPVSQSCQGKAQASQEP